MPKSYKNKSIITVTILVVCALLFGFYTQYTKQIDITNTSPAYTLDANALTKLITNKTDTMLHPEAVIEIEGAIKEINYLNDRTNILLNLDTDQNTMIICDMQGNQDTKIQSLKVQDTVKLKGIYKGILKDVILLNCVISQ